MRKTTLNIVLTALVLLLVQSIQAEVKLPAIISSNMVLQRNTTVVLWGWADAKKNLFSVDRIGAKTPQEELGGYTGWESASPVYKSLKVKDGGIVLKFKHAETGLPHLAFQTPF